MNNERDGWTRLIASKAARAVEQQRASFNKPTVNETKSRFPLTEAQWQAQVLQVATLCGWQTYHTHDSRNSADGFPDLVCLRPPRQVVVELKKMGEEPTPEQVMWLELFSLCGAEVHVWRPSDFDEMSLVLR